MAEPQHRDPVVVIDGTAERCPALPAGLAQRYRVLEPDIGRWDGPAGELAHALAAATDAQGWPRYALVGVSAGAAVALRHALQSPERVAALALISPTAIRPAAGIPDRDETALENRLGEIRCPTLVVFGQDDASVAPEAAGIYRERIPNCSLAFVYDAGHAIAAERPQALVNLVADYLERRETFIVENRSRIINP